MLCNSELRENRCSKNNYLFLGLNGLVSEVPTFVAPTPPQYISALHLVLLSVC